VIEEEVLCPPEKAECMPPVPAVVSEISQFVQAPETAKVQGELGIEALQMLGLAEECHGGLQKDSLPDETKAQQNGGNVQFKRLFHPTPLDGRVEHTPDFLLIQVTDADALGYGVILPAMHRMEPF
jgi:hypothetical protein